MRMSEVCRRLLLAASASSLRSPAKEGNRGERPVWPCVNYPAASKLAGTQVHSQQALIRVSFIQTTVFIEQGLSSGGQGLTLL